MALSDHYPGGLTERLIVHIITVDPPSGRIEGVGKDAAVIQIGVNRAPMLFRWPVVGEHWTIIRENGSWTLESKIADPDGKNLGELNPGEAMVQSNTIWTPDGEVLIKTGDTSLFSTGDIKTSLFPTQAGWRLCDGATLLTTDVPAAMLRTALVSASNPFGVSGADPKLPDLRGRAVVGTGSGAGLTTRALGASGGEETHPLSVTELPSHNHGGSTAGGATPDHKHGGDSGNLFVMNVGAGVGGQTGSTMYTAAALAGLSGLADRSLAHDHTINSQGGNGAHNNMQPFVAINYLVKL
jgi:microcystin-dependent protein